jgi:methylmalonyl-CoA mutase cobalamin-binding subunit
VARTIPIHQHWPDSDCAERVAGAIEDLSRTLKSTPHLTDPAAISEPAMQLERHLILGAFGDALTLCKAQPPGQRAALFLSVVTRLEARWRGDTIGFAELAFAFYLLRHLIDHATLRAPGPMLPVMAAADDLRILVALAHGETHSFGAQILAAELAAQGWAVTLDLSGEAGRLRARITDERFDVLTLSVGHDGALHGLADLIADLRHLSLQARLSVILGGAALAEPRAQYTFLGADTLALTVAEGVAWIFDHRAAPRRHHRN